MTDIKKQINEVTLMFLQLKMIEAMIESPELKELNFFKQLVETPDGGEYLLHFQHIKGPKIDLHKQDT